MMLSLSVPLFAMIAGLGAASPSFSCKKAANPVQRMICNDDALAALDRKLADVYGTAAKTPSQYDDLNLRQRDWIQTRDKCWQETNFHACIEHAYVYRIAELQARYKLVPAKEPVRYTCPGAQPDLLTVTFFSTDPPSAVLDSGVDSVLTLFSRAGGTPHYEVGQVRFRERGTEASVVWGDRNKEIPCTLAK